jgi:hypothetical protein
MEEKEEEEEEDREREREPWPPLLTCLPPLVAVVVVVMVG